MNLLYVLSLLLAGLAVVGAFISIPPISDHAFWIAVAAYLILAGMHK